MWYLTKVT